MYTLTRSFGSQVSTITSGSPTVTTWAVLTPQATISLRVPPALGTLHRQGTASPATRRGVSGLMGARIKASLSLSLDMLLLNGWISRSGSFLLLSPRGNIPLIKPGRGGWIGAIGWSLNCLHMSSILFFLGVAASCPGENPCRKPWETSLRYILHPTERYRRGGPLRHVAKLHPRAECDSDACLGLSPSGLLSCHCHRCPGPPGAWHSGFLCLISPHAECQFSLGAP